jgi:hypothetical protein
VNVATGRDHPPSLAVDATNVYWFESAGSAIFRAPRAGGGEASKVATASGGHDALYHHGGKLYWLDARRVYSVPVGGGTPVVLVETGPHYSGFAVDGDYVYFARQRQSAELDVTTDKGGIARAPVSGGPAVDLFRGECDPKAIALDGGGVYWIDVGKVIRTPKP